MKSQSQFTRRLLSIFLAAAMLLTYLPTVSSASSATLSYAYKGDGGSTISDPDTSGKYPEFLGENTSTEYAGRIWADKSVYTDDVTFDLSNSNDATIQLNENKTGEDFLVAYSVLATTESVSTQTKPPVDVVLIIDISGSMSNEDSNMDNGKSRIYNTVQATNNAIEFLMEYNSYTRIAVVAFSSNAQVLLPLGRYSKNGKNPYFTLNRDTGSSDHAVLYTNAVDASGKTIKKETNVRAGTNIQMGLYEGMKVLTDVAPQDTTVTIDGERVQRVPSVILLSDGAPTYSSSSRSWWEPDDNSNDGPGDSPYVGNGMKAILVGSYMKDAIDRHYSVTGTDFATKVYTVGMGITNLESNAKDLAYLTLDPGSYWDDDGTANDMAVTIKGYWNKYTSNENTGTLNIPVSRFEDYYLTHPTTGYDVNPTDGYDYVDEYYGADNASSVTSVFSKIVSNIAITGLQVPTELKGGDITSDGYITYTDPIGKYMEVKDIKAILYAGQTFTTKSIATTGSRTTYTFTGQVTSPVYGIQSIQNILITVKEADGQQTLEIKIPASVIPLRTNEVVLNSDGVVKSHTSNHAMPARIIYSVGLRSEITKEASDGTIYIDREKLSADYLAANEGSDGTVLFFSNEYTGSQIVGGATAGDATVEFEPSHTNRFYYTLEDTPLYKDAQCTEQLPADGELDDDSVYYYRDVYFHGNEGSAVGVAITGAQLKEGILKAGEDGCLYRGAGSVRLERILPFDGTKAENITETAEAFHASAFYYKSGSSDAYEGKFMVHLGNNGALAMVTGGNLEIRKTVEAAEGLTAPDRTFEFTVDLTGSSTSGTYNYVVADGAGNPVSTGTISENNAKISLKDGQTATIFSLPPDASYTVTEVPMDGFISESDGRTGIITPGKTSVVCFTNTYTPTAATATLPTFHKVIAGDRGAPLKAGEFAFELKVASAQPLDGMALPAQTVVTNAANGDIVFDEITFTKVGTYAVTVKEIIPGDEDTVPGIAYSSETITAVYTVTDDSNGSLIATLTQLTGGDSITNHYTADAALVTIDITKTLTGRENDGWLATDQFDFAVTPDADTRTAIQNGDIQILTDSETYTIAAKDATASAVIQVNKAGTYRFVVREVDGGIPGITYDQSEKEIVIVATDDSDDARITVRVNGKETNRETIRFTNEYQANTADPVVITANKVVTSSDGNTYTMEGGEFTFVLTDSQGNILSTASNAKDGIILFDRIVHTVPGIYTYTVSEEVGTIQHMTYDKTQYVVEVTVTDDGNGKLIPSTPVIRRANSNETVAEIVFENIYSVPETPEEPTIPEEPTVPEVPDVPKTGDSTHLLLASSLMLLCGSLMATLPVYRRKKKMK